jgi:alpha-1,2-mannosyltransferase
MSAIAGPDRRRALYTIAGVLLVAPMLVGIYWPAGQGLDITGHQIGRDFINVWVGPQLAFGGRLATLFDLHGYHAAIGELFGHALPFHNWGYPLFVLPVFWPLAQLPYFVALAVWTFGLFAIFAAVVVSELPRADRAYAVVVLAFAPACLINAIGGQNGFLSAVLLLGGVMSIDRRPVLAGVLFGLLTFKPHLGLLLPFVLLTLGAWHTIAAATVTAAVLVGSSVLLFGIEPWWQYLDVASSYQLLLLQRFEGFYTVMMTSAVAAGRMVGLSYPVALAIQAAIALPTLLITCWAVRRTADPCRRAFVVACAAPLVTPYAFNYDLTALSAALVWVLFGRLPCRSEGSVVYLVAWLTPIMVMFLSIFGIGFAPLAILALFGLAVREAVGAPADAGTTPSQVAPGAGFPAELATPIARS